MTRCIDCDRAVFVLDRNGRCWTCRQIALADLKLTKEERRLIDSLAIAAIQDFIETCAAEQRPVAS